MENNKQFGVVFIQMRVTDNKTLNIRHAEQLIRVAASKYQPKLIVLPEYFTSKWGQQYFERNAELFPSGQTNSALAKLAAQLQIHLVAGSMPERDPDTQKLYNTSVVFSPAGEQLAKYLKIHLVDMTVPEMRQREIDLTQPEQLEQLQKVRVHESDVIRAGQQLATFEIEGIRIGLGLGYDLAFQEMALLYRKQGVQMIVYPAMLPSTFGPMHWEQLQRVRAIDNQMYVLSVTQAKGDAWSEWQTDELWIGSSDGVEVQFGRSMLVNWSGQVVARAGDGEEMVYAVLKFDELEKYRGHLEMYRHKRADIYETVLKN